MAGSREERERDYNIRQAILKDDAQERRREERAGVEKQKAVWTRRQKAWESLYRAVSYSGRKEVHAGITRLVTAAHERDGGLQEHDVYVEPDFKELAEVLEAIFVERGEAYQPVTWR